MRTLWRTAFVVALAMAFGAASSVKASAQANAAAQAPKRSVLVFPFDVSSSAAVPDASELSSLLTDVARSRFLATNKYVVYAYYRGLPTVARLHNDQDLTDADVTPPFSEENAKPIKIAKLAGYDLAFVGSVDDYSYDADAHQATVTISGRLLDAATGKILKSITLSASSAKGGTAKEPERALEAGRTAGEQLMAKIEPLVSTAQPAAGVKEKPGGKGGHHRSSNWLWGVVAIGLGLGIGLSSGN
ncbi:MAG: hypothetical protein ACP5VE_01565 [Chthonomonadales bacterium]